MGRLTRQGWKGGSEGVCVFKVEICWRPIKGHPISSKHTRKKTGTSVHEEGVHISQVLELYEMQQHKDYVCCLLQLIAPQTSTTSISNSLILILFLFPLHLKNNSLASSLYLTHSNISTPTPTPWKKNKNKDIQLTRCNTQVCII